MASLEVYNEDNQPSLEAKRYQLCIPTLYSIDGEYRYAFEIYDECFLGDANGNGRIHPDDHETIGDFIYAIKTFCREKHVWIRIWTTESEWHFPEFYRTPTHKRIMDFLERWSLRRMERIRKIAKKWYRITQQKKLLAIYNILYQTVLPDDCIYIIIIKNLHQNASHLEWVFYD